VFGIAAITINTRVSSFIFFHGRGKTIFLTSKSKNKLFVLHYGALTGNEFAYGSKTV
jgi:hypothetical protein